MTTLSVVFTLGFCLEARQARVELEGRQQQQPGTLGIYGFLVPAKETKENLARTEI